MLIDLWFSIQLKHELKNKSEKKQIKTIMIKGGLK